MRKSDSHPPRGGSAEMATSQRILEASMTLFARRGYHGTGIREIAETAGLSTAALYHYMGNKEDLIVHIMREANTRLVAVAEKAIAQSDGPADQIAILARVLVTIEALHRITVVGDTELRVLTPESAEEIVALRDAHERQWANAIRAGVKQGVFQVDDEQLARFALVQMCTGVAHWYTPDGRLTLSEIANRYSDMSLTLLNAHRDGQPLTTAALGLHDASVEIDLAMKEFESFISPRARPTHFAKPQKNS